MRWFEYPNDDFPFYNREPVDLAGSRWLCVVTAVALGFACLTVPVPGMNGPIVGSVRVVLFLVIPLVALRAVAGASWKKLFRRPKARDVMWMVFFAVLNLVVSSWVGLAVMHWLGADVNPAVSGLTDQSTSDRILFFLKSIPQLIGEEVLTILPLLGILYLSYTKLRLSRTSSFLVAWVLSSIIFGLVHLPSYNWKWVQCILVIGSARLVLTLAYVKTKNLWVSSGAHIINDWMIFGLVLRGTSGASR